MTGVMSQTHPTVHTLYTTTTVVNDEREYDMIHGSYQQSEATLYYTTSLRWFET